MIDPLKTIAQVERRLAGQAALQALTAVLPAALLVICAGMGLGTIGAATWERMGYVVQAHATHLFQTALVVGGAASLLIGAGLTVRSFARANRLERAASALDRKLQTKAEVATLAALAEDPSRQSPLFPLLWRRVGVRLERLDVAAAFPLRLSRALKRASGLGLLALALLALVAALVVALGASPGASQARVLRQLAKQIAANPAPAAHQLAQRLASLATALENPSLPASVKTQKLAEAQEALAHQPPPASNQQQAAGSGQKSNGNGSGNAKSRQQGNSGSGGSGNGNQSSAGAKDQGQGKQLASVGQALSKAQALIQTEGAKENPQLAPEEGKAGQAPRPNPNAKPGSTMQVVMRKNGIGKALQQPTMEHRELGRQPLSGGAQGLRETGLAKGDTHLGEFPAPQKFEHFYKPGETGPPLLLRNARFVLFRLPPPEAVGAGGGKTIVDRDRPNATVPFHNVPLKEERVKPQADEYQLIPPRYRALLQ